MKKLYDEIMGLEVPNEHIFMLLDLRTQKKLPLNWLKNMMMRQRNLTSL